MEILTYVIEGTLAHRDSMGNGSEIRPGDVQRMSAGPGVTHSEYNASPHAPVHFLQIWIMPSAPGLPSGYEQKHFPEVEREGVLRLLASSDGAEGSLRIQQDARLFATVLAEGRSVSHTFAPGRLGWIHVVRGEVELNGQRLMTGDGAALSDEAIVTLAAEGKGEVLLFDLPR